jgi:hypothetical protein
MMYKLIIGNVRVTIHDDATPRNKAIAAAQEAVQKAGRSGKQLSQIDIYQNEDSLSVRTTEKAGMRASRKTLKQSMADSILAVAKERLSGEASGQEIWTDEDSGQQWHGTEVENARSQLLTELLAWLKPN